MRDSGAPSALDVWCPRRSPDTTRRTSTKGGCVRVRTIAIGFAALVGLAGTAALAEGTTSVNGDGTIVACQKSGKSFLRVVRNASDCRKNERVITWNVSGPAGPPGPAGPAGPTGPAGPAGAKGDQG